MTCQSDKIWSTPSGSCKSLCPSNCRPDQLCVSADNGCSACEQAYYGRQCQHRIQCRYTEKGVEYRGTRNTTENKRTCQRWASDDPHEHDRNTVEENYCRNFAENKDVRPWCFTVDPNTRWEYCDVPMCDDHCPAPSLGSPYVDITNPPPDGFTEGFTAVIDVTCSPGYETNGKVSTTCKSNKTWSSASLPVCIKIQCPTSSFPSNSRIINEMDKYEYEDIVTIGCNNGYTLEGNNTLDCLANKSWSHPSTTCKINECPAPSLNARSNVTEPKSVYVYRDLIKIACDTGFVPKGSDQLTCQADRTWDMEAPICEKQIEQTSNVGAIVGGTVGGILGIAVVVIVIVFLWRRRRKSFEKKNDSSHFNALEDIKNIETEESGHNVYVNIGAAKANFEKEEPGPSGADDTYCNIQEAKDIVKIKIENLRKYLKDKKNDLHFFEEEFKTFPVGLQRPAQAAMRPKNKSKNKYKNIYPYDDNRIMLTLQKGVADSDFINASPIKGYNGKIKYIAAQGPQDATHVDFWRMIYEKRIRNIVMLTNAFEGGVKKCIQYWPDEEIYEAGAINVELQSSDKFADYTIRRLKLTKDDDITFVHQHHFTTWPDKGVPKCPSVLAQFHKKVFDMPGQDDIPIVVHCSAGIGRTGTFIALDYLLDEANKTGSVGISKALETLREQRVNMVQTKEQYAFLHDVLVDALELRTSVVKAAEFSDKYKRLLVRNKRTGKILLQEEFESVNESTCYLKADACTVGKREENKPKNRYNNILPTDDNRVHLSGATEDDSYINAVYLPGYRNGYAYIITQAPLSNTIEDFWKLIFDEKIACIVALNQNTNEHEMYWPIDKDEQREYGDLNISLIGKENDVGFQCLTFQVCHKKVKHVVKQFQINVWPDTDTIPSTMAPMLKLMDNVQLQQNETTPVLVHCMNGADKSGLFCTAMALLDKLKSDQEVAVQTLVKQMKSIRPQIIPNLEQYQYCYTLLGMYIESFETYSNFS